MRDCHTCLVHHGQDQRRGRVLRAQCARSTPMPLPSLCLCARDVVARCRERVAHTPVQGAVLDLATVASHRIDPRDYLGKTSVGPDTLATSHAAPSVARQVAEDASSPVTVAPTPPPLPLGSPSCRSESVVQTRQGRVVIVNPVDCSWSHDPVNRPQHFTELCRFLQARRSLMSRRSAGVWCSLKARRPRL